MAGNLVETRKGEVVTKIAPGVGVVPEIKTEVFRYVEKDRYGRIALTWENGHYVNKRPKKIVFPE